ncbi:MAG: NAD(P)-binding domain-containing protein [Holophagales bacterium]|nr:MAG: NAD(P)-binding domain-containing protein [Holophagales bacterium]
MTEDVLLWAAAFVVAAAIVVPYAIAFHRTRRRDRERLVEARGLGIDKPHAQFPFVDAVACIGCGSCVRACPEGDVLGVVGGIAVVVNGIRCVGHGRCAEACPVGAIEVGLGDLKGRPDVPILDQQGETTVPGVFVAGELSGLALVRNAVEQGEHVVDAIARRLASRPRRSAEVDSALLDVLIVGAGPAGLAAALAARHHRLSALVLDQAADLGGTILHFPRRKLVLTRPVPFPLGGGLDREEYSKEELLELLAGEIRRHGLEIRYGARLARIERDGDELRAITSTGTLRARQVVLSLGRRGTPRTLGVPGEELPKVMYQLRDAETYRGQRLLVVGGGDSAVEAAIGLARQPGNRVTVSYRKSGFFRIKRKNEDAIAALIARGKVQVLFDSQVTAIHPDQVSLETATGSLQLENDYVFVLIGGDPPYALLRGMGVRFGGEQAGSV